MRTEIGVPLAKVHKELELDISYPALQKLITLLKNTNVDTVGSLYPEWLEKDSMKVQEQPDNYKYNGYFPYGEWIETDGFN